MPLHLPPLSRRQFIAQAMAAAGAFAFNRKVLADTGSRSWALLSDTHLAADGALVSRGVNMSEHFKRVAEEVVRLAGAPAGVMITGDCAYNSGELADYSKVGDLLVPLRKAGLPVHLALGNHDHREHFWQVFKEEKAANRPLQDRQMALLLDQNVNWYILDSLEATLSSPGLLGPEQLKWLARALDENPKVPALVVIHHNPGLNGGNLGLKDTLPLFEIIRPRTQVKAYIYGHTHSWKVEPDTSGIHLINLPPVSYVFREGEPSGWVHARIRDDGMQLELRCVDTSHKAHGQTVKLQWRV